MKTTLDVFKREQANAVALLKRLQDFLKQGEAAGVEIDAAFFDKLQASIQEVAGEKLKVALVGGFSEGKTTLAAAWIGRLDKESMKIDQRESTDAVTVYDVSEDFVLIDTPGLFGFKEQQDGQKYKDITRRYVSEANLLLYVMDPANPVKDSHRHELNWLLRDLSLLPRTVFVLSRFDAVADVEDEQDYQAALAVKRDNVRGRLREMIGLDAQEVAQLQIVAVAADPFDQGVEYWLANPGRHQELSHIASLQAATVSKIEASGGAQALVAQTRQSIVGDVLGKQLPVAIANDNTITAEVARLDETVATLHHRLETAGSKISDARIALKVFVTEHFAELIAQAKGTDLETWSTFFEREIGAEGIVLRTQLQNAFERHLKTAQVELQAVQASFSTEINHFNAVVTGLGKQGVKYALDGGLISNTAVLGARDGIVSVGKALGADWSSWLKFKPHGAAKFAKGLNGVLAVAGVAFELWDSWSQYQREVAFAEGIATLVEDFEKQRRDLLAKLEDGTFVEQHFPNYVELQKSIADVSEELQRRRQRQVLFRAWREQAEALEADYLAQKTN